jgi:predicted outer membrane repeat protein
MKALLLTTFVSAILIATPLFGATFSVNNPTGFQTALTMAQSNNEDDVINVEAGTYNITTTLTYTTPTGDNHHKLTIQEAGAGSTILDGGGTHQIMYINTDPSSFHLDTGSDIAIIGLTFQNGSVGANGGGAYVHTYNAAISLTDNVFTGNSSTGVYNGGGAYLQSSSAAVTLTGNTFTSNSAGQSGGGLYAESISNTVTVTGNTFTGNGAVRGGGANVYSETGSIIFTNNVFAGNPSSGLGGGAYAEIYNLELPPPGPMTFTNNTFYNNTATNYGGGAYLSLARADEVNMSNIQANVYNNIFWNNVASKSGNDGDDLYVNTDPQEPVGSLALFNNDFSGNADFSSGQSEDLFITDTSNNSGQ